MITLASPPPSLTPSVSPSHQPLCETLPSGLTLVCQTVPVPAVSFDLWVRVGSAMEEDGINGMAHFLEHMIFKGSDRLAGGELERQVEAVGGSLNASTSQDYTHFYFTCAPQHLAHLAPAQINVVTRPAIPTPDFHQERQVVLEEIRRSQDNPQRRISAHQQELLFQRLPYRRPILGPAAVIETLTPEQMRSFHQHWYVPSNMTIVVVGNLPLDDLRERTIAALPPELLQPGPTPRPHLHLEPEPAFQNPIDRHYQDPQLQEERLILAWKVPGLDSPQDTYALDVLADVLAHGRTSRLIQRLREQNPWARGITAHHSSYQAQGIFSISAKPVPGMKAQVQAAIWDEIQHLRETPIRPDELQRIKTQVAKRFIFAHERPQSLAQAYGYYQTLVGSLEPALTYADRIGQLSPDHIQAAAQRHLQDSYLSLYCSA